MESRRGLPSRIAETVVARPRRVVFVIVLLTLILGGGIGGISANVEIVEFGIDSPEADAQATIEERFGTEDQSTTILLIRGDDVLTRESLRETMALQAAIRTNETVAPTLAADQPTTGVSNAVAVSVEPRLWLLGTPTIEDKMDVFEAIESDRFETELVRALDPDRPSTSSAFHGSALVPTDYRSGETATDARLLVVQHDASADSDRVLASQYAIETLAEETVETAEVAVIGEAIVQDRSATATGENFRLVGPIAVLLVTVMLWLAYRDPVEVALTLLGIGLVLLWTAGFIGWAGLPITQLLVAVPCLLVGLAIDYGLHVGMRYREERIAGHLPESAMRIGLAGVVAAIGITTVTTAIGFLSGLASPIAILREFGLVAAVGIVFAFVIFGLGIPSIRVMIDRSRSTGPEPPAIGHGPIGQLLDRVTVTTLALPLLIVGIALLLAVGGAAGAHTLDTHTEPHDFLPGDRPDWMTVLPADLQPADHGLRDHAMVLDERFAGPASDEVYILIDGDVTHPETLERIAAVEEIATAGTVVVDDGTDPVTGPTHALATASLINRSLGQIIDEADTTNDGVPNRDLETIYDAGFSTDRDRMESVIFRTPDGEYHALRVTIAVDPTADPTTVTRELREAAKVIDAHPALSATVTGDPILAEIDRQAVLETVIVAFALALSVIAVLATILMRHRHRSWRLGPLTVLPVVLALAWLLGIMTVFSVPFNAETALITGIAIGIGVDYSIHITERFQQYRATSEDIDRALRLAVRETGGTVAMSAMTTAVGFGVLALMFIPSLQRFGIITATVVLLAFLASVVVLPPLLKLAVGSSDSPP